MVELARNQLRVAGMGQVIGFDLPAVLTAGDALGADREELVWILPEVESGMLEGMAELRALHGN